MSLYWTVLLIVNLFTEPEATDAPKEPSTDTKDAPDDAQTIEQGTEAGKPRAVSNV